MSCTVVKVGGTTAIVCTRGERRQPCASCGRDASIQCDYPVRRKQPNGTFKNGTCDRHQCEKCATEIAPNVHHCKPHAAMGAPKL
jgi:hypothetical protein